MWPTLAVVKDQGGINGLLPVIKILKKNFCHDIKLIANGNAIKILSETNEDFEALQSASSAAARYLKPRTLLTSICSDGGVGRDLVPILKGFCPTVAFHDFWGTYLLTAWKDIKHRPDFFIVNDKLDAHIVLRAWPDYHQDQLIITGYPMFDQYAAGYDHVRLFSDISSKLGVAIDSKPIVLFTCGIHKGASRFLSEVVGVLNDLAQDVFFIPRYHPRLNLKAPEEIGLWASVLKNFRGGTLVSDSSSCSTPDMIRAAAVVLSDFSTTLLEATLVRKPNISICYLGEVQSVYQREFGGILDLMPDPPFVMFGCSAKAIDKVSLSQQILDAIKGRLDLRSAQEKYFPLDGKNAWRAAKFVDSIV